MKNNNKKIEAFLTPTGTAMWASIIEPNKKFNADGVYMIDIQFDLETIDVVKKMLEKQRDDFLEVCLEDGTIKGAKANKVVVADVLRETEDKDGNLTGGVYIKAKQYTKTWDGKPQKVTIVDASGRVLQNFKKLVGNGSQVRAKLYPKPYYMASTNTVGISLRINAVQIIDLIEFSSNGQGSDFEAVEGGFTDNNDNIMANFGNVADEVKEPAMVADANF
ncbi:Gp2.5-like ssDNA binding protein and ssDNA annealing protein [Podophage Lau218]|uniref:Phage ssDNA-binding protein n=2 Tax=Lauvirus lau218 TaxID=1465639 RepID=A0A060BRP1_9CAUD|nr:Gp2.5-like ssDNA binding protein and ssDNA annealing protein [Podophage Lau218]AIA83128.1 phage ssDNA-binding protein [Podophage Lau218]AIA83175.1 phage ssDNA-binding protein [Lauvirus lau218]AIA83224.1 phage ssDNA-binding protein [Lauvirus lau218]